MSYQPLFMVTPRIIDLVGQISEAVGRLSVCAESEQALRLRRINRIRTIHGSLAIEGNTLSEEQITAILEGRHVIELGIFYYFYAGDDCQYNFNHPSSRPSSHPPSQKPVGHHQWRDEQGGDSACAGLT